MRRIAAGVGAAIMALILLGLVGMLLFAIVVMPFYGVYEPLVASGVVAVIAFAAWGFVATALG